MILVPSARDQSTVVCRALSSVDAGAVRVHTVVLKSGLAEEFIVAPPEEYRSVWLVPVNLLRSPSPPCKRHILLICNMSSSDMESDSQRSGEEEDQEENGHEENGNGASSAWQAEQSPLTLAFPISRVRRLVKSGSDVQWVGMDAGFLIAKAAEVFLEKMVEDAFDKMLDRQQNAILYPHLSNHVASTQRLEFLSDFVPIKIPGAAALANIKMADQP